ncbi:MAG: hypothetical protein ACRD6N_11700 [Pyrinomonadaceae bacterium]
MKKTKGRKRSIILLVAILAVTSLVAVGVYSRAQTPAITNKTSAVEVISVTPAETGTGYKVVMKNVSAKNINAYAVGYDRGASVVSDQTGTRRPIIAPGEQFKLRSLPANKTIVIRYVIFDDNSVDGDAVAAAEFLDQRLGVREQLERIVPLFREASDVDQLRAQIEALPEQSQASVWVGIGMRYAKQDALLALQKLDKTNVRAGLNKFIEESESRMARLPQRANP